MADPRANMPGPKGLTEALGRNIEAVAQRRAEDAAKTTRGTKLSTAVGAQIGRMWFVYAHLAGLALWVLINTGLVTDVPPFDPHFSLLGTIGSIEAIFLSIFILITQNHAAAADDRRDDLALQVNLLTEHELTQLIKLNIAMAERLGIDHAVGELADLQEDVEPAEVLDTIERAEAATTPPS